MKNKEKIPEILAPAGSFESLKAAVSAGCDAVYIGGSRFGARAYADNPEGDEMLRAIDYCHLHGVKIYMTVNTLIKEREMDELYPFLKPYYEAGLDAVIVQDVGALKNIHEWFPDMEIHASTQMTITMGVSDELFKKYGVTRIVPARELTLCELEQMRRDTSLEMEVFVHGALCYCYSGQCLFSSMLGGRSGNRGRCAQPCRQPYLTEGQRSSIGDYVLSPKELSNLPYISEMIEAGIDSFKIEGRMKRPEYTAFVTSIFRKYIDLFADMGKSAFDEYIKQHRKEFESDIKNLQEIYNRGGFTQGYLEALSGVPYENKKTKNGKMLSAKRPKHGGVLVGEVISVGKGRLRYKITEKLYPQDVVEFCDDNMIQEYEYTIGDAKKAGSIVEAKFKYGSHIHVGDKVYRTKKAELLEQIRARFIEKEKKVSVSGIFYAAEGQRSYLKVMCGMDEYTVYGDICDIALKNPATKESVSKSLMQTGTTQFEFEKLDILIEDKLFIPVGMLKKMRREALGGLEDKIISKYRRNCMKEYGDFDENNVKTVTDKKENLNGKKTGEQKEIIVSVMTLEQLESVLELNIEHLKRIYLRTELLNDRQLRDAIEKVSLRGIDAYIVMPHIFRHNVWEKWSITDKCAGYVIKNFEEFIYLTHKCGVKPGKIVTDAQMYTMNSSAVQFWRENGVERFTMPFELTMYEMDEIAKMGGCEFILYTHVPMMVSAQCIRHNTDECAVACRDKENVNGLIEIEDRKKRKFTAINYCKYCYNIIYQTKPLYLKKYEDILREKGISSFRYDFTFEDKNTVRDILSGNYRGEYDEGHMINGVE